MNKEHEKQINKTLVIGWSVVTFVAMIAYYFEVQKGERNLDYFWLFLLFLLLRKVRAQDDALVVVAEAFAEYVHAAHVLGILFYAHPHTDGMVLRDFQVTEPYARNLHAVHKAAFLRNGKMLEQPVLRTFKLPPQGRVLAAFVAEIPRRRPGADFYLVNPDGDV